ncbi:NAD(P)/FAD-dependent oxidoreductase [Paenibacillus camelliae]|uniref:NAD(P)/FAD-dependent oxidoreductase n=1 Tax=Paenibacillus camelliae TaxID=512410 RepID=UPI00203DBBE1|nr:NAD(P)/FAD-dependent oxidoreductase [Paenibacillus camelliae]
MMIVAIIGGGPAGLNAALVLARANHQVLLFDNQKPRNAVTGHMHGFITREGIAPSRFRRLAHQELRQYPNIKRYVATISQAKRLTDGTFTISTKSGTTFKADRLLLATGLKESLPGVSGLQRFYGKSMFSCPYCDGYELSGKSLAIITESNNGLALSATLKQWSSRLHLFTNGKGSITSEERELLQQLGVVLHIEPIKSLTGREGKLKGVVLQNGKRIACSGGFVSTYWQHAGSLVQQLGCRLADHGGIWQDGKGRTSIAGVYAAGDVMSISPAQAVLAAGDGVRAAISINQDIAQSRLDAILKSHQSNY